MAFFLVGPGAKLQAIVLALKGGDGSGNFGHAGRPGERGGSAPSGEPTSKPLGHYRPGAALVEQQADLEKLEIYGRMLEAERDYGDYRNRNILKTDFNDYKDPILGAIVREQGFDGLPTALTTADFEALVETDDVIRLYRGVSGTPRDLIDQFINGPYYVGLGISGNGTYASTSKIDALEYSDDKEEGIMHLALRKDAKLISHRDASDLMHAWQADIAAAKTAAKKAYLDAEDRDAAPNLEDLASSVGWDAKDYIVADPGRMAALLGYDAIDVGHGFYVILNRTAVYAKEQDDGR